MDFIIMRYYNYFYGHFPATFLYNGIAINHATWTNVDDPIFINFGYTWHGDNVPGIVLQAGAKNFTVPGNGVTAGTGIRRGSER